MPKELSHWWLADEAVRLLPPNSQIRQLLEQHQSHYLIGAVLPDTLLHLVYGPWSSTALALAHHFHTPQESSYAPLIRYQETAQQTNDLSPQLTACLLGIATHIEADIVFHPFVCALAGDNIAKHYATETELDLWLLGTGRRPPVLKLKQLLNHQSHQTALRTVQGIFDPDEKLPPAIIERSLQLHALIQGMYGTLGWQILAACLAALPIPFLRNCHNLFYPFFWQRGRSPAWPKQWQSPADRMAHNETPDDLAAMALERIVSLLQEVEEQGVAAALSRRPGENLVTGISPLCAHNPTTTASTAQL